MKNKKILITLSTILIIAGLIITFASFAIVKFDITKFSLNGEPQPWYRTVLMYN